MKTNKKLVNIFKNRIQASYKADGIYFATNAIKLYNTGKPFDYIPYRIFSGSEIVCGGVITSLGNIVKIKNANKDILKVPSDYVEIS